MKRLLIALFPLIFLISCADTSPTHQILNQSGEVIGNLNAGTVLPQHPDDCSVLLGHGVQMGDRLDVALRRVDARLDAQNARVMRCHEWYDQLRTAIAQVNEQSAEVAE